VREVSAEDVDALVSAGAAVLDVRETEEWQQGHLPGAIHIPRGFLELRIEERLPASGRSSSTARAARAARWPRARWRTWVMRAPFRWPVASASGRKRAEA
jgi:rhodanese-related sulfurtransferase